MSKPSRKLKSVPYQDVPIPGWPGKIPDFYRWAIDEHEVRFAAEIGVYLGASLVPLTVHLRGTGRPYHIYGVDIFKDDSGEEAHGLIAKQKGIEDRYLYVERMLLSQGGLPCVTLLQGESVEASRYFASATLDLVMLDGDHSEKGLRNDIEAWLPKVIKNGGILAGHDYANVHYPHVGEIAHEIFGDDLHVFEGEIWYVFAG